MNDKARLCKMSVEDLESVLEIQRECRLSNWTFRDYLSELDNENSIKIVARLNDSTVGFLIMRLIMTSHEAELCNIGVTKKYRRRKIGKSLLERAFQICRSKNIASIWLEARSSNENALNFYQKNEFQVVGRRKNFYRLPDEDAILMKSTVEASKSQKT